MASTVRREIGNDQSHGVYRLFRSALKYSVRITPTKRVRQRYRYLDLTPVPAGRSYMQQAAQPAADLKWSGDSEKSSTLCLL